jgi:ACT domain-containing protein
MRTSVIVTALGPDKHGLLAAVASAVAEQNANIDDVSQTVSNGMFTMIMFVSFDETEATLQDLQEALAATGERTGLQIHVQHESIFRFMHGKATGARLIPAYGKRVGDHVRLGGLFGEAPAMAVSGAGNEAFVARRGRIPAPLQSLTNWRGRSAPLRRLVRPRCKA